MSKFILDAERHELLKSDDNEPIQIEGSLFIRDKITGVVVMTLDTLKTRQFFNLNKVDNNSNNCTSSIILSDADETSTSNTDELNLTRNNSEDCTDTELPLSSNFTPAKWTDANAVRALISNWKNHKNDFKNMNIRNNKVWQMIAYDLKKENPLWNFTSIQCENKFKDVRKSFTKVKDHNNQSGAELKTCKFYDEMEAVLGEKPIIKAISISSTLKRRICPSSKSEISPYSSDSCKEKENESNIKKKSKIAKKLDKWSVQQKIEAKEREEARMQRHKEKMERQDQAIMIYKKQMEKLLEKL